MRQYTGNMNGERYLANTSPSKKEVHDLDNEDTKKTGCQIDEIIEAKHDKPYTSKSTANADGYDDCDKCLTGSTK